MEFSLALRPKPRLYALIGLGPYSKGGAEYYLEKANVAAKFRVAIVLMHKLKQLF